VVVRVTCPECGHSNHPDAPRCDACGVVAAPAVPVARPPAGTFARPVVIHVRHPEGEPPRVTLSYLGLGAVAALVFTLTPLLKYMGWFLASLVHEMGHCAAAWAVGCPAFPAIRLDGHAAAVHGDQSTIFALGIWVGLGFFTWRRRDNRSVLVAGGAATLVYPLLAFTGVREWIFLLAGHLGELAIAGVFFWRAFVGGFTRSRAERVAYAACAWYLLAANIWLSGGLLFDEGVRQWYRGSGSFGLVNDYLRLAGSLHVGLSAVAFTMLLVSLAVLPLAWRLSRR